MEILKSGIWDSVQDLGRKGQSHTGVNRGGAMDKFSLRALNILLSNPEDSPAIEFHYPAPVFLFNTACRFALFGADFSPNLSGKEILTGKIYEISAGDILNFSHKTYGQRCYFAIQGSLNPNNWLNSYSINSFLQYPIMPDSFDIKPFQTENLPDFGLRPIKIKRVIRFVAEFEYDLLNNQSKKALNEGLFSISSTSNRMGYRFSGELLNLKNKLELSSSGVSMGTIQLLPDGNIVILMADAQTTGGYPRLGFVIEADLKYLSQIGPGEEIRFKKISFDEGLRAKREEEDWLEKLRVAVRLRNQ